VTAALAEDDTAAACTALETFQRRIDQRAGRVLTVVQAYQLWYECAYIQYVLGCIAAPYEQPLPPRRPASQVGTSPEIDAGDESAALPRRLELAGAMDRSKPIVLLSMPQAGHARVEVLDVQGRVLGTAFDGELEAGFHRLHWEGRFEGAGPVATGMYFYRVTALGNQLVAKTAVVR
jgi:hypothetical protein